MMQMYFQFSNHVKDFLFKGWTTESVGFFAATCVAIGVLAIMVEAVKLLRLKIQKKYERDPLGRRSDVSAGERTPLVHSMMLPPSAEEVKRARLKLHIGQSILHVGQLILSYLVMLAVMYYNAWIGITVAIASGIGFFVLGAKYEITSAKSHTPVNEPRRTRDADTWMEQSS